MVAIVLAAGLSRRMGQANKMLLPFGDSTILETTLQQLSGAGIVDIIVVTGHEHERVKALLQNHAVQVVFNSDFEKGMTTSIQAGILAARAETQGWMICLADMPLLTAEEYALLIKQFTTALATDPKAIVQPRFHDQPGNPVIFSACYREPILALDFPEGARPIVQGHRQHIVPVPLLTDHCLRDIDTPEDFYTQNLVIPTS
jgi:molybdenum cofactor cytidylyltransferase